MKSIVLRNLAVLYFLALTAGCSSTDSKTILNKANQSHQQISPSIIVTKKAKSYNYSQSSNELAENLPKLLSDPDQEIRVAAKELLKELPIYKNMISTIPHMSKGKQLDIILNMHASNQDTAETANEIINSAKLCYNILTQNNYEVITAEALWTQEVDFESLPYELSRVNKLFANKMVSVDEARQYIAKYKITRGEWQFMEAHPEQKTYGYEVPQTGKLLSLILVTFDTASVKTSRIERLGQVGYSIQKLRSELAIARTLQQMSIKGQNKAGMIMGFAHLNDLQTIAEDVGLNSRIYITVSPEALMKIKLEF